MKTKYKILISVGAAISIIAIAVAVYLSDFYRADEAAIACLFTSADAVSVTEEDGMLVFAPEAPKSGIIFYPGGKVQAESYAPLMTELAKNGILSIIVTMPANLAIFGINSADGIAESYPQIERWYMAGHSLGGSAAAMYLSDKAEEFEGLILLASYSTEDLTKSEIEVLSVYGSKDKVLNMESYENNKVNLPKGFTEVIIDGGCHSYFGSYGEQDGDGKAKITREDQISKTVSAVLDFID